MKQETANAVNAKAVNAQAMNVKAVKVKAVKMRRSGAVQLRLLPGRSTRPDWVLDERTRAVGRQGVAQAREILRRLAPPEGVRKAS